MVRVTVAYSDTFPVARGCHCNRLDLYHNSINASEYLTKMSEVMLM